jgi:hypothetical protein
LRYVFTPTPWERREGSVSNNQGTHGNRKITHAEQQSMHAAAARSRARSSRAHGQQIAQQSMRAHSMHMQQSMRTRVAGHTRSRSRSRACAHVGCTQRSIHAAEHAREQGGDSLARRCHVEKSQQRPTPLAGRAEVLCDSAYAPAQSVLNAVPGSVLAPARRPTLHCHGPQSYLCQGMSFSGWPRPRGVAVRRSSFPCAVRAERDTQVHATPSPARRNPQKSRARPFRLPPHPDFACRF